MKVLVLGGTADARALAAALHGRDGCHVVTSLAGRTSEPADLAGTSRSGGFGGAQGLARYLRAEAIDVLVDATHPFARVISEHAAEGAEAAGVRLIALRRPQWAAGPGDRWTHVADVAEAARCAAATPEGGCVFVTTGRQELAHYADDAGHLYVIRTIEAPSGTPLPPRHIVVQDRGPYDVEGETALMERHDVRTLVTKNSGGTAVAAKLEAARRRGILVIMVDPPALPAVVETAGSIDLIIAQITAAGSSPR